MVKSSSLPPDCVTLRGLAVGDGHSTDTSSASERLFGAPSEGNIANSYVKHNTLFVHGTFKEIIIGFYKSEKLRCLRLVPRIKDLNKCNTANRPHHSLQQVENIEKFIIKYRKT